MSEALDLLKQLITCPSITPNDAGCQNILRDRLQIVDFQVKALASGEVNNLWVWHGHDQDNPRLVFLGHTDVVPPGNQQAWHTNPFVPVEKQGRLYGRGACDMKSGLACIVIAMERFVKKHPNHPGMLGLIVTSDEEGPAKNGTIQVAKYLKSNKIVPEYCIVGEASSNKQLGDAIKIGRRGSMYGKLVILGKQGHVAYPHLADNPISRSLSALDELSTFSWDEGNDFFTPTAFQYYRMHADSGADNIIPGVLTVHFNFRFAPIHTEEYLQQKCQEILDHYQLDYHIMWEVTSLPFFSGYETLAKTCAGAIKQIMDLDTVPNTYGGTSDGRFMAAIGSEVVELGPVNTSAHHVNEHVLIADLEPLTQIYEFVIEWILLSS